MATVDMTYVHALADTFAQMMRETLSPAEWTEMARRNVGIREGVCASHDFVDANEVMADAFEETMGWPSLDEEGDDISMSDLAVELWNAAWTIATPAYLTAGC